MGLGDRIGVDVRYAPRVRVRVGYVSTYSVIKGPHTGRCELLVHRYLDAGDHWQGGEQGHVALAIIWQEPLDQTTTLG